MNDPTPFTGPHHLRGTTQGRLNPVETDQPGRTVAYAKADDEGFIVTFYESTEYMEYMSKQAGHPIFRLRIMTRLVAPGNTKTIWEHPTTGLNYTMAIEPDTGEIQTDYEVMEQCENGDPPEPLRFPRAWNRFLRRATADHDGVPIEEWGAITKTFAASLKMMNVHTVQGLAGLTDGNAQNIMGALKYRDLAKAYLSEREKTRLVASEQAKAERAQEEAADLRRQVKELQAAVGQLTQALSASGVAPVQGIRIAAEHGHKVELQEFTAEQSARRKQKKPPRRDDETVEVAVPEA